MGLLVYKFSDYEYTAERKQYRNLCKQLKSYYGQKEEICIFIANYNIYDCELDGILIKQDAIINIEFKNYGGNIIATDNGDWKLSDGTIIKGGSRKTVYKQAKLNHIAIRNGFKDGGILPAKQVKDIATLVVFHQSITLVNQLSPKVQSWLHIADENTFLESIQDITSQSTDLSESDMLTLVKKLALSEEYLDKKYSNTEILNCRIIEESNQYVQEKIVNEITFQQNDVNGNGNEENELTIYISQLMKALFPLMEFKVMVHTEKDIIRKYLESGISDFCERLLIVKAHGISDKTGKIEKFIKKQIFIIDSNTICWVDSIQMPKTEDESVVSKDISIQNIKFRKAETMLPLWLDKYLFDELHAIYAPEHTRYEYNLDLNEDELKVYMGTYFPRSYAELFCIADNLLGNKEYLNFLELKREVNVLDVGCGTGGELIGLLMVLEKYIKNSININIWAFDGNEKAMDCLQMILKFTRYRIKHTCNLHLRYKKILNKMDLKNIEFPAICFDFIFCNKIACELLSHKVIKDNCYEILAELLTPYLNEDGILLLLDVTTKNEHSNWFYPQLMNLELNKFTSYFPQYVTLLPVSCSCFADCRELCYMQQTFKVNHSRKAKDESRVCYRIICHSEFRKALQLYIPPDIGFIIHSTKYKYGEPTAYCMKAGEKYKNIDSFNINI